jgi:hypothetical protein
MTAPNAEPSNEVCWTESPNSILVVIDGPGDTTRRPRRPEIPLTAPRPHIPKQGTAEGQQQKEGDGGPHPPDGPAA